MLFFNLFTPRYHTQHCNTLLCNTQHWNTALSGNKARRSAMLLVTVPLVTLSLLIPLTAKATINVDRTRIIMNSDQKSITLELNNSEKNTPYLAQSWIENADGSRSTALIALPPLQRIDGGQKSQVRILQIKGETDKLPDDRETLFYYNVRGIPPKPDKSNVVQLTQQSRLKLFWRPQAIKKVAGATPERRLIVLRSPMGLVLKNPTAYYITVVLLTTSGKQNLPGFSGTMIAPFGEKALPMVSFSGNQLYVGYVDDFGGLQVNPYQCSVSQCSYH